MQTFTTWFLRIGAMAMLAFGVAMVFVEGLRPDEESAIFPIVFVFMGVSLVGIMLAAQSVDDARDNARDNVHANSHDYALDCVARWRGVARMIGRNEAPYRDKMIAAAFLQAADELEYISKLSRGHPNAYTMLHTPSLADILACVQAQSARSDESLMSGEPCGLQWWMRDISRTRPAHGDAPENVDGDEEEKGKDK